MRRWKKLLSLAVLVLAVAFLGRRVLPSPGGGAAAPWDARRVAPEEARDRIGREAVVCGRVAQARHLPAVEGAPTFLNFGGVHPRQAFTAVIWGRARTRFDFDPADAYRGATICVAGRVEEHEGTPQIEVRGPAQIRPGRSGRRKGRRDPAGAAP